LTSCLLLLVIPQPPSSWCLQLLVLMASSQLCGLTHHAAQLVQLLPSFWHSPERIPCSQVHPCQQRLALWQGLVREQQQEQQQEPEAREEQELRVQVQEELLLLVWMEVAVPAVLHHHVPVQLHQTVVQHLAKQVLHVLPDPHDHL
jgi:hypothetical protein